MTDITEGGISGILDGSSYAQASKPANTNGAAGNVIKMIFDKMKAKQEAGKKELEAFHKTETHEAKLRREEELHAHKLVSAAEDSSHNKNLHQQELKHNEDKHKVEIQVAKKKIKEDTAVSRINRIAEALGFQKDADQKRVRQQKNTPSVETAVKCSKAVPTRDLTDAVDLTSKTLKDINWEFPFRK
jgi:hypothetical protein